MTPQYFIGLDLGQARDFSALAVLRPSNLGVGPDGAVPVQAYDVIHLKRFPLGLPYPTLALAVAASLANPSLLGSVVVVDRTGVGRAVVDLLAERFQALIGFHLLPVTITSGRAARRDDAGGLRVPKRELVNALQALVCGRLLRVSSSLREASTLVRELEAFRVRVGGNGWMKFGADRTGQHDDLVIAVALAAWAGRSSNSAGA